MLSDDERRELGAIEAELESDTVYATHVAIGAGELGRHDRRPWRWSRISLVAALLCVVFLVTGVPSLALVGAVTAGVALAVRVVVALRAKPF